MRPSCRISIQERNCYCNGPGAWNKNMLQCGKCRRWYHDKCVQCLESPMIFGDKFFVFICSICNSSLEFLARIELKWADIVHLVLYNLTVIHKKKYFDLQSSIMPFLTENWTKMNLLGEALGSSPEDRKRKVLQILQENKKRFKSGNEVKKCRTLWCLREFGPPVAPHVVPVPSHTEQEVTIWEFKVHGRKSKILFTGKKQETRRGNAASKGNGCGLSEIRKSSNRTIEASKSQSSTLQNGNKKPRKPRSLANGECVGTHGLLDSLIPILPNYKGGNNPFKSLNSESKGKLRLPPPKRRKFNNTSGDMAEVPHNSLSNGQLPSHFSQSNGVASHQHLKSLPFDISKIKFSTVRNKNLSHDKTKFQILGKRTTNDKKVQFLFEWKT